VVLTFQQEAKVLFFKYEQEEKTQHTLTSPIRNRTLCWRSDDNLRVSPNRTFYETGET